MRCLCLVSMAVQSPMFVSGGKQLTKTCSARLIQIGRLRPPQGCFNEAIKQLGRALVLIWALFWGVGAFVGCFVGICALEWWQGFAVLGGGWGTRMDWHFGGFQRVSHDFPKASLGFHTVFSGLFSGVIRFYWPFLLETDGIDDTYIGPFLFL